MTIKRNVEMEKKLCSQIENDVLYSAFYDALKNKEIFDDLNKNCFFNEDGIFKNRSEFSKPNQWHRRSKNYAEKSSLIQNSSAYLDKSKASFSMLANNLLLEVDSFQRFCKIADIALKKLGERYESIPEIDFNKKYPFEIVEERNNQTESFFNIVRQGYIDPIDICYFFGIVSPVAVSAIQQICRETEIKSWKELILNFGKEQREFCEMNNMNSGNDKENSFSDYYLRLLYALATEDVDQISDDVLSYDILFDGDLNDKIKLQEGVHLMVETYTVDTFMMWNIGRYNYREMVSDNIVNTELVKLLSDSRNQYFTTVMEMFDLVINTLGANFEEFDMYDPWFTLEQFLTSEHEDLVPSGYSEELRHEASNQIEEVINDTELGVTEMMDRSGETGTVMLNISVADDPNFNRHLAEIRFYDRFFEYPDYDNHFNDVHVYLDFPNTHFIYYFGRILPILERMVQEIKFEYKVYQKENGNECKKIEGTLSTAS